MIPITPERAKSLIENARKAGVPEEELQEMIKSYEDMKYGKFPVRQPSLICRELEGEEKSNPNGGKEVLVSFRGYDIHPALR